MKTKQFVKEIEAAGCRFVRHGGNHDLWYSPLTGNMGAIPRHDAQEMPKGLERKLRRVLLGQ